MDYIKRLHNVAGTGVIRGISSLILLLLIPGTAFSQVVSIHARFDTSAIRIGEQTLFTVLLEQPAGLDVSFPLFPGSEEIEVLESFPPDTAMIDDDRIEIKRSWRVTSFLPGEHYAGPMSFVFTLLDEERVLNTARTRLEVVSPDVDMEAGIYDIKAPFSIPVSFTELLPWIAGILLLAVAALYLARYYWKKRRSAAGPVNEVPDEPAHFIAMRELRELKAELLWQKGLVKEYYTRLTEIVRRYIERRFGILAMEKTSREILAELRDLGSAENEVMVLLEQCFYLADLVKFAKVLPEEEQHEVCLNTAFHFVKASFEYAPEVDGSPVPEGNAAGRPIDGLPEKEQKL